MSYLFRFFGAIASLLILTNLSQAAVYPGDDWDTRTPEQMNVDSAKLNHAMSVLRSYSGSDGTDETLVIRDGYVIWSGNDTYNWHEIWSVTKSFTSTALGLLVDEGKITEDTVAANYNSALWDKYSNVKFKHFASHTSGYNAQGSSRWPGDTSQDWSTTPYTPTNAWFSPGTQFLYWDEAMMMYSRTLTKVHGGTLKGLIYDRIANPIGMDFEWNTEGSVDGININNGAGWMFTHARDLARFAYLYEREGNWSGQQLISKSWVNKATSVQADKNLTQNGQRVFSEGGPGVYGYNFWVNGVQANGQRLMPNAPAKTYFMSGLNHNMAFVIPEWDMVIVRMGQDGNPSEGKHVAWNDVLGTLAPGVSSLDGQPTPTPTPSPTATPEPGNLPSPARLQDNWNGLYINTNSADAWQQVSVQAFNADWWSLQWEIESAGNNVYRLKNRWTGLYLSVSDQEEWSALTTAPLEESWGSMKWIAENISGNKYRLKNEWTGLYINTAENAGELARQAPLNTDWGSMIFTITGL